MEKLRYTAVCMALLFAASFAWTQNGFLGKALGETVNTEYEEMMPRISPDGQTLYFVRSQHPGNVGGRGGGQDIWTARRKADGTWGEANRMSEPINNERHNFVGAVGGAGDLLVLGNGYASERPGIAIANRTGNLWVTPKDVLTFEGGQFLSFHCTPDLAYLILSLTTTTEKENLYVSIRVDGRWENPMPLGKGVNTTGSETAPFITEDGKRLFFTSTGHPDHMGGGDIYMVERQDDTWQKWSEPLHLGPAVNTAGFDGYLCLDSREETAYFTSGATSRDLGDIYQIPVSQLPLPTPPPPADTLFVQTTQDQAQEVSFVRYGVPDDAALLVVSRSLDGPGKLLTSGTAPHFLYQPAPGWSGKEKFVVEYCDPPQSDNCKEMVLSAVVEPREARPPAKWVELRTPVGTPVRMELPPGLAQRIDLKSTLDLNAGRNGSIKWNNEVGSEYLRYTPDRNFAGFDTLSLVELCDLPDPFECIVAKVVVDVYGEVAVVDPIPEEVVVEDSVPVEPKTFLLYGKITEDGKNIRPGDVDLRLYEEGSNRDMGALQTKEDATYEVRLPAGVDYRIEANSPFHLPEILAVPGNQSEVERNISLRPVPVETGQVFTLNNIYFDLNKATLRPESTDELRRLFHFLQSHPTMEIEVRGHTDSQNTEDYNQQLSEDRVKTVVNYLKYRGIMGSRLRSKGFGESQPVADNETPEGRQQNRRVEFKVLKQ